MPFYISIPTKADTGLSVFDQQIACQERKTAEQFLICFEWTHSIDSHRIETAKKKWPALYSRLWNAFPWASYQIRKIVGCAYIGNEGNVFPATDFKGTASYSYPSMHHGTCATHMPWCMPRSLTRNGGENVPSIPGPCAIRNFAYLATGTSKSSLLTISLKFIQRGWYRFVYDDTFICFL